jgi:hypothetical protein
MKTTMLFLSSDVMPYVTITQSTGNSTVTILITTSHQKEIVYRQSRTGEKFLLHYRFGAEIHKGFFELVSR